MRIGGFGLLGAALLLGIMNIADAGFAQTPAATGGQKSVKSDKTAVKDSDSKETAPVWTSDISKAVIPQKPASGRLHGEPFTIERAELQGGTLSLRQGHEFFADLEFKLFLFVNSY